MTTRRINATFTRESVEDLKIIYGIDMNVKLESILIIELIKSKRKISIKRLLNKVKS